MHRRTARPTQPVGLYDPSYEHDACGVAMVARLSGDPCHETVQRAVVALENLEHRGAAGADPNTGDGAGMLLQLPDELLRAVIGSDLPPPGRYGVAVCFLPQEEERRAELEALLTSTVEAEGQTVVGWRDVPVDKDYVGITANYFAPYIKQLVVAAATPDCLEDQDAFERRLYVIRRVAELAAGPDLVVPSFSSRTIVYKGMLTAPQLLGYYPDLQDQRAKTALALVHSRFSTNTFPSWELAHPYRYIAHNGEINTLRGNVNWMRARESQLATELFGDEDLAKLLPIVRPGGSDSATFDNVLELLVLAGRSLPHAVMMMVPEAYEGRDDLPEYLKGFYAFHSCLMEPWDGPAAIAFTDGRVIGATLDRNGLRPGRWLETKDGWVVLGSETGVMDEPASNIVRKGRLQPGKLFLVDLAEGRIVADEEVKHKVATAAPYGDWYEQGVVHLADLPDRDPRAPRTETLRNRQLAFGYTQEDLRVLLDPDRGGRRRADRLDGQRPRAGRALGPPAGAVLLLQAALRAGDQPADRPDPRVGRHERRLRRRLRGQPVRRDGRARAPAVDADADPALARSSRSCARSTRPSSRRTRSTSRGRRARARTGSPTPSSASARRPPSRSRAASTSSSSPTATSGPSGCRSRRCWRSPPCTTTSCARARACRRVSCSSPASRARSTTSRR